MIQELDKNNYQEILNILDQSEDNIEVKSVIKGYSPGRIFVDEKKNPKTAMIWSKGIQGFYFVGDQNNNEFNDYLLSFISKKIKDILNKENLKFFEFSGETNKWDAPLEDLFNMKELDKSQQFIYYFNKENWKKHNYNFISKKYKLLKIEKNILNQKFSNIEFLLDEINLWWDNIENFLNRSSGYIVCLDDKIVSYALGNYLVDEIHLMGIETLKEFRRKGLSQACCEAFIDNSLSNNIIPRWECMSSNIASQKLAEKLGFKKSKVYNLYSIEI